MEFNQRLERDDGAQQEDIWGKSAPDRGRDISTGPTAGTCWAEVRTSKGCRSHPGTGSTGPCENHVLVKRRALVKRVLWLLC